MNWITVLSTIVLAGAALAVLTHWVVMPAVRLFTDWRQFLEDWRGEPARPGIAPERLGVLARLSKLEESAARVEHEVKPNDGASMKDQINRIEEHVVPVEARPTVTAAG